jgi:hypothetical protein
MTVAELITKLQVLDPDAPVVHYWRGELNASDDVSAFTMGLSVATYIGHPELAGQSAVIVY